MRNDSRDVVVAVNMAAHTSMISLEALADALGRHLIATADSISACLEYRGDDETATGGQRQPALTVSAPQRDLVSATLVRDRPTEDTGRSPWHHTALLAALRGARDDAADAREEVTTGRQMDARKHRTIIERVHAMQEFASAVETQATATAKGSVI